MAVESIATGIHRRMQELKVWLPDDVFRNEVDQLTTLFLQVANDQADAREMLDQEKLKNFRLERKLDIIGAMANDLMAPAHTRMDQIRDLIIK